MTDNLFLIKYYIKCSNEKRMSSVLLVSMPFFLSTQSPEVVGDLGLPGAFEVERFSCGAEEAGCSAGFSDGPLDFEEPLPLKRLLENVLIDLMNFFFFSFKFSILSMALESISHFLYLCEQGNESDTLSRSNRSFK